jgi:hypothetical protein
LNFFCSSFAKNFDLLRKILPLFSYLLHPIFVPVFGALLYFKLNENFFVVEQVYLILIQISIIMVFIPICFFYLLRTLGKVDSVMLSKVSQRKIPLAIQVMLIAILIGKSITLEVIPELYYFFLGGLASTVLALLLSFLRIKASLHMMGTASLFAFTIGLSMHNQVNAIYLISLLALANGIVAASRLEMQAHSGKELIIGSVCGLLPQLALWYFWL